MLLDPMLVLNKINIHVLLKKRQISKPIALADKWVIIRLEGIRKAKIAKFEDVKGAIANNLSQEALQEFAKKELENANINIIVK